MKIRKSILSILLALCMVLTLLPATAHADRPPAPITPGSGKCGENLTWTMDDAGTLTISGTGPMTDYGGSDNAAPWRNRGVRKAVIKSGVTTIGNCAFYGCSDMTGVTIPKGVTTIGDRAFADCYSLTSVTIPEGVKSIGYLAFNSCHSLTSITIPKSVEEISQHHVFTGCYSLTAITVAAGNACYSSLDGVLFNKDRTALCYYPNGKSGSYTVPSTVRTIMVNAFQCSVNLTGVTIPEGVTTIGSQAFYACDGLTAVRLPASVTELDPFAFGACDNLRSITAAEGSKSYSSLNGVLFNKDRTELVIYPVGRTEAYTVPDTVKTIGSYAILHGPGPSRLTVGSGVTAVSGWAIDCIGIKEIVFKGRAPSFGDENWDEWLMGDSHGPTVYYPAGDATWTDAVRQTYDGPWSPYAVGLGTPTITGANGQNATGKPTLKWNAVSGAAKYAVYRSDSKDGTYTKMYTTTSTSYTNTSANAGYTYYYKVVAVNGGGVEGLPGTAIGVRCRPAAPTITSANGSNASGKPTLKWNAVSGAKEYVIYRSGTSNGTYTKLYTTTNTSFTNTGANAGYTYYYKVYAVDKDGYWSVASAVNGVHCRPAAPTVTATTGSSGKPYLKWSAVTGAREYVVYRATSKTGSYTKMFTTTNTSYTNTTAKAGNTYWYKVYAVDAKDFWSAASTPVSAKATK